MITFTFRRDGREASQQFDSLTECCHAAALREHEDAGQPLSIQTDDGRRWEGRGLRALLDATARRHGWTDSPKRS